jgi:transposase
MCIFIVKPSMQTKRSQSQMGMVLLPPLEAFIPDDYPLRRLNRVLDLSFVHEAVRGYYCQDNGRPSIDPEVIIRLFLIQAIEGIPHVRDLMRQVQVNMAYRWFIGYELDEELPDHSTLSRALDRFGDKVFNDLFEQSIARCKASGLIEGKILHVDATTIRADVSNDRVGKADSPDPDARFGRFPGGSIIPGYKQQTIVDNHKRVIVGLTVFPANKNEGERAIEVIDEAIERTGVKPEVVCADGSYGSGSNKAALEERDIRLISPPRTPYKRANKEYFIIEDFEYDEVRDEFICPAGQRLTFIAEDKERPGSRRRYRCWSVICKNCQLKDKCTKSPCRRLKVSADYAALLRLRSDSHSDSFKQYYRLRAPAVEGVFGEAKKWHSLGRAWRRGIFKMFVQSVLIAAVINFKRLASLFIDCLGLNWFIKSLLEAVWRRIANDALIIPRQSENCTA